MSQVQKPKKGYKSVPWLFGKEIEIPEEWEVKKIDYVIKMIQSGISRLLSSTDIGYVIATSGNIQNGQFDISDLKYWHKIDTQGVDLQKYILNDNDILLNFINSLARIGKSCIFKKQKRDWIFTTNIFRIRSNDKSTQQFLSYILNTNFTMNQINAITQPAINQASFSQGSFKKIKILIPPLPEQQQIASILSNVDSLIESTSKIIENSKSLKTGLMQKLLTRGISHTKFKKVPWLFGKEIEIPEDWEVKELEKFSNIIMGMSPPSESYNKNQEGLPFYQGVTDFGENYPNTTIWCSDPKKIAEKDQILFSVRAPVGETNITKEQSCLGRGVCSINPLENELMYCYFLISYFKKQFVVYAQGTTYDAINRNEIVGTRLPFTSNKKEQQKIATILSNIDAQINSQTQYKEKLERLKKSLMQKLLTGEVRVAI